MSLSFKSGPNFNNSISRIALISGAIALCCLSAHQAHAIGGDSDGWVTAEPGHPILGWYQMRNSTSQTYSSGKVTDANAHVIYNNKR